MSDSQLPPPPPTQSMPVPPPPPGFGPPAASGAAGGGRSPLVKRLALATGGVVLVAGAVGGGIWAYNEYFGQGPQPAEALPAAGLLGYTAIDLDPSGEQKVEAVEMLNKFPAAEEYINLDASDDVKAKVWELAREENDDFCADLDYDDDIDPWIGDRFGFAVYENDGDEPVQGVVVLQVTDADAAEDTIGDVIECVSDVAGEDADEVGYAVDGDWMIISSAGEKAAKELLEDGQEDPLSDDEDFQDWTDKLGDAGIATSYTPAAAGERFIEIAEDEGEEVPPALETVLEDFTGAAGVVRFEDGTLQAEAVMGGLPEQVTDLLSDAGTEALSTLPSSTAGALGFGLADGWMDKLLDEAVGPFIEAFGMDVDSLEMMFSQEVGITFDDVETLLGESVAFAQDGEQDPDVYREQRLDGLQMGLKIKGDTDEIERIITKLRARVEAEGIPSDFVLTQIEGDYLLVSLSPEYLEKLASEDGLGDSDRFEKLVPKGGEANFVFYLDLDALYDVIEPIVEEEEPVDGDEILENVEPLDGLGISVWTEGDELHTRVTLSTD